MAGWNKEVKPPQRDTVDTLPKTPQNGLGDFLRRVRDVFTFEPNQIGHTPTLNKALGPSGKEWFRGDYPSKPDSDIL